MQLDKETYVFLDSLHIFRGFHKDYQSIRSNMKTAFCVIELALLTYCFFNIKFLDIMT